MLYVAYIQIPNFILDFRGFLLNFMEYSTAVALPIKVT